MAKDLDRGEQAFGLEGLEPEGSITTNYFLVVMAELALHHTFDPWCLGALVANKTSLGERLLGVDATFGHRLPLVTDAA